VSQYQKGKTNLDFTEARDSEWQRHQLGHMQVCTLLQTDNHASTPLQAGCPSCRPTNSIKALKVINNSAQKVKINSPLTLKDIHHTLLRHCLPKETKDEKLQRLNHHNTQTRLMALCPRLPR